MALVQQQLHLSYVSIHHHNLSQAFPRRCLFVRFKNSRLLPLRTSTTDSCHLASPVLLPFPREECGEEEEKEETEESEAETITENPHSKCFDYRASVPYQDPKSHGSMSPHQSHKSPSHLAYDIDSTEEIEMHFDATNIGFEQRVRKACTVLDQRNLSQSIVGEMVHIARSLPENFTLGEALRNYVGRVSDKECLEVLRNLVEEDLVLNALYFFEWMKLLEPSCLIPRACTLLFPVLGRAKLGDSLMALFKNLPCSKEFRDVHVYNAAISGLMYCGRFEDAWKVYGSMDANNVCPDHVTCAIIITVMRKTGRSAKDAWEFFERMNRKGVNWSPEVLGALVKSFCDEGLVNKALIIQSEMERKGIVPNAVVYNTLMDTFVKSNHLEEAEGLFVEMKSKGIKPTSSTFNILTYAYSRRMQPDIVEKLLIEMQELGLRPNAKSYTCLISAYGRQKKMSDMAQDAFLRMKKAGIKPTSNSYTALIHAYSVSGRHEKAYTAFENMQVEGIRPSIETYTALLDVFRRAGDTQKLMKIWKIMINEKIEGTRVTFNILVDGFAKQGQYSDARDVIREFGKIGLHPTVMTYNMLMNAHARGGQHHKLPQVLREMASLNLKPDSFTYMTMIYAYVRVRDFQRSFFYHRKMLKSGQMPDVNSYKKLMTVLDREAKTKNKDRSALQGIIKSKLRIRKKDEFWKFKKRHVKTDISNPVESLTD